MKEDQKVRGKSISKVIKFFDEIDRSDLKDQKPIDEITLVYKSLSEREKLDLFELLLVSYDVNKEKILPVVQELINCDPEKPEWHSILAKLRDVALSPRFKKLRAFVRWPGGLKFLLDMRGDILMLSSKEGKHLFPLEREISLLFENWFQEGFLYLEEITLDSPYRQIEIIKNRDLVHPMTSIEEMGDRLGKDRRCFALYHKIWPLEPIVFIEVALHEGIARSLEEIMGPNKKDARRPDTAIFYSINNTQNGLAGLGLGKVLIFKVVEFITSREPNIKNFTTLSPLPGFYKGYLRPILSGSETNFSLGADGIKDFFKRSELKELYKLSGKMGLKTQDLNALLLSILDSDEWHTNQDLSECLKEPLRKIAFYYVAEEKSSDGKPLNPVASFHLGNGANVSLRDINFLANRSQKAFKDSLGFMVNYIYSFSWLTQIGKAIRWLDRIQIKGLMERWF